MLTGKTALELSGVAASGGSIELDARSYTALELSGIASHLKQGAYLKLHHSSTKTPLEMQGIAAKKPGQVIFA